MHREHTTYSEVYYPSHFLIILNNQVHQAYIYKNINIVLSLKRMIHNLMIAAMIVTRVLITPNTSPSY